MDEQGDVPPVGCRRDRSSAPLLLVGLGTAAASSPLCDAVLRGRTWWLLGTITMAAAAVTASRRRRGSRRADDDDVDAAAVRNSPAAVVHKCLTVLDTYHVDYAPAERRRGSPHSDCRDRDHGVVDGAHLPPSPARAHVVVTSEQQTTGSGGTGAVACPRTPVRQIIQHPRPLPESPRFLGDFFSWARGGTKDPASDASSTASLAEERDPTHVLCQEEQEPLPDAVAPSRPVLPSCDDDTDDDRPDAVCRMSAARTAAG
eukprot:CAMPEP_0194314726 /NCGR_PEP_ID=MMETSP0171-20130528/11581_1 /TAXON_ID=218684 /ORGANISM="Corethron pennatum, Strain L29A3" /LENGTH=258 /DNA_ID=CAMNT_0039070279 /DNA_START=245 /DNA_END=1018 /DNA_ORIENTATION=-